MAFVHLHVHSYFSFYDGTATVEQLAERAAQLGMPAIALTDYNGVYGAVRFIKAARKAGIKPITGAEVTVSGMGRIVLLSRSAEGYTNLCRLLTDAAAKNPRSPVADLESLAKNSEDLFALLGAALWDVIIKSGDDDASRLIGSYLDIFGTGRLAIELENHGLSEDAGRLEALWKLAKRHGILAVATNNVHLLEPEDYPVHKALIDAAKIVHHRKVFPRSNGDFYLKSEAEMARFFAGYEEAMRNTEVVAAQCSSELPGPPLTLPSPLEGRGLAAASSPAALRLREICETRLRELYESNHEAALRQLDYELSVIDQKGFSEYFLTVADLAAFARARNIRHSCRGSAPGSLVVYLLGISRVDPIENGLLFERFLNPERPDIPDIDMDFESGRRDEVIEYAMEKYRDRAAMVATVSRFRARSAIREIGRATGLGYEKLTELTRSLGYYVPASKIREAIAALPELRGSELGTEPYRELLDICSRIDSFPRHLSVHLGGLVTTEDTVVRYSPLLPSHKGWPVLSFDKDDVEDLGLIKTDVLGLRMLAAIEEATALIRRQGKDVDLDSLDTTDKRVYALLQSADTLGCFQVESPGMRGLLPQLMPEKFSDIVSAISLFRPGPVQADMVTPFVARRRGREKWGYFHESLKPILEETCGVVLFQEQAIRVIHEIAGFSYGKADLMRRAMEDPASEKMMKFKQEFLEGAARKGFDQRTGPAIFDQLSVLAAFGFNKSHAASFARIVFQSAYLKAYHTAEFMTGVLNSLPGMYPERVLLHDARRFGVALLGPDINASEASYTLEKGAIRVGLRRIRDLGPEGLAKIMEERSKAPFWSFEDFRRRVKLRKKVMGSLVLSGVFDALGAGRKSLIQCLEQGGPCAGNEDLPLRQKVALELENIGLDLSAHAMSLFREELNRMGVVRSADLKKRRDEEKVVVAGIKTVLHTPPTRSGIRVVFLTLEDETGLSDVAVFPDAQELYAAIVYTSDVLVVEGRVRRQDGSVSIVAEKIRSLREGIKALDAAA
jgi:error-prone DNA polymerase